jgi:hypothetical protein
VCHKWWKACHRTDEKPKRNLIDRIYRCIKRKRVAEGVKVLLELTVSFNVTSITVACVATNVGKAN